MGRRIVRVSPEFVLAFCKEPGERKRYFTVQDGVPRDARLLYVRVPVFNDRLIELVVESDEWAAEPEGAHLQVVEPSITVRVKEAP